METLRVKLVIIAAAILMMAWAAVLHTSRRAVHAATQETARQTSPAVERKPRPTAPRLPAAPPPTDPAEDRLRTSNIFARLMAGDFPSLLAEEVEPYLVKNRRSAASLLGAFNATGDRQFLREAMEKYPDDPRVSFAAFFRTGPQDHTQPASEERRRWLESFTKSAPDNPLANYLLAFDSFKSGQMDQAVQQLLAAAQKGKFQDYSLDFMQNTEEAFRAAGWSEAEAKAIAASELALPHLAGLRQAGLKIIELAELYRQNGDDSSARTALDIGLGLSQHLTETGQITLIHELVGLAIESKVLEAMDAHSLWGGGQTVQDRLDAVAQRREDIKTVGGQSSEVLPTLSEQDLANYFDRLKTFGEATAAQWLLQTHSKPPSF